MCEETIVMLTGPGVYRMSPLEKALYEKLERLPEVRFVFLKQDRTERRARGTRNLQYIPLEKHLKTIGPHPITTSINYYDLDRQEWRSFRIGNLLRVENI